LISAPGDDGFVLGTPEGLRFESLTNGQRLVAAPIAGNHVAITPDGARAFTAAQDGQLVTWDIASGGVITTLDAQFNPLASAIAVFPDGDRIVVSSGHSLTTWDLGSGQPLRVLNGHTYYIDNVMVRMTPLGMRIVSGSRDTTVRIWDPERSEPVLTLTGHTGPVWGIWVPPSGKRVISCGGDGTVCVSSVLTGQPEARFTADSGTVCCACAPDERTIVAADLSGQIHFLEFIPE
jgi:WD40 repeat protein